MGTTRRLRLTVSVFVVVAAFAGAAAGCTDSPPGSSRGDPGGSKAGATAAPGGEAQALQRDYEAVVRHTLISVVQLNVTGGGLGSGIIYDKQGHIVTNAHVLGRSTSVQVLLATGGAPLTAHLVAAYTPSDLAVVKLDQPRALAPAAFADSTKLRVGQIVLAMGNPLGLSGSVTSGIISAVGRTVPESSRDGVPGTTITSMIQTSAPINPGNSGGALVDLTGKVVGIPTLAATDPQVEGGGVAAGIGFAIPSNTVTRIAGQIISHGRVVNSGRAALGVTGTTVTDPQGTPIGVGVVSVRTGSGAANAGILRGDVITAVNGVRTPTSAALGEVVAQHRPGQLVTVSIRRQGKDATVKVKLGQL
ncbi:S1C family serine protease [Actinopolymorpha singaporensis]|uniref:Serine protease, S1-C subfamily, contains C-terminal PDZ domain n=1 Tax=Actinopolymorpha singaporensis TaxID=117157 RepID=A0A1H1TCP3_9ACTN|nr:trypsin-like peptidase domain-containing protein [Actinopolymorpha singaporensis]SDS57831.1 serine protease, S1-C subfamily, contains C-terminal PDZ domain [Actinopolymorpha singaporensis]